MRDLFLGCVYVRMCQSTLGMSICGHAQNVNLRSRSECQFALTLRNSGVTDM